MIIMWNNGKSVGILRFECQSRFVFEKDDLPYRKEFFFAFLWLQEKHFWNK